VPEAPFAAAPRAPRARRDVEALARRLTRRLEAAIRAHDDGDTATAEAGYREVLRHAPDQVDASGRLGVILFERGDHAGAADLFERALTVGGPTAARHANAAVAWKALGRGEAARTHADRAIEFDPDHAEAWRIRGELHLLAGETDAAIAALRRATALDPEHIGGRMNLGVALYKAGRLRAALAILDAAEADDPSYPSLHMNRANVLRLLGRFAEAEAAYREEAVRRPDYATAWSNLGVALNDLGRSDEALECFTRALALDPDADNVRFNRAFAHLARGDLAEAWADYDRRPREAVGAPAAPGPSWDRAPMRGRLLVRREQGLGDEIKFLSALPFVRTMVGGLVVEVDPRLVGLAGRSFPGCDVRPLGTAERLPEPDYDAQCFLADAFFLARTAPSPAPSAPYLVPDSERARRLEAWLAAAGPGLRVGISWRSMLMTAERRRHYARLEEWAPVLGVAGTVLVNLQYDEADRELDAVERDLGIVVHRPPIDLRSDQEGVAALASRLDVVVSAGNAVAQMAGAVGTHVLELGLRENPWLLGGERFPWFPTMEPVCRSHDEDWSAALAEAGRRVAALASACRPDTADTLQGARA
jgi:tetratricopeptide (TPR) repeat protein